MDDEQELTFEQNGYDHCVPALRLLKQLPEPFTARPSQ